MGCFIFAPEVITVFREDPEVVAVGKVALRAQCCALPLSAMVIMSNMMLQSIGKGVKASITSSASNGICFIPLILLLPNIFGLFGVEITQTAADVFTLAISFPIALSELKKL